MRDASGTTDGVPTSLGNLIVGWDEDRSRGNRRSGSHNIILGSRQNYTSYGGFVAGENNEISAPSASILGGQHNSASGDYSSVSGGDNNTASGIPSSDPLLGKDQLSRARANPDLFPPAPKNEVLT